MNTPGRGLDVFRWKGDEHHPTIRNPADLQQAARELPFGKERYKQYMVDMARKRDYAVSYPQWTIDQRYRAGLLPDQIHTKKVLAKEAKRERINDNRRKAANRLRAQRHKNEYLKLKREYFANKMKTFSEKSGIDNAGRERNYSVVPMM